MKVLGVDPGTANIGIVVTDHDGKILYKECWRPPDKGVKRLQWIWDSVSEIVIKLDVTDAVIEGYSYMSKWRAHDLGEVGGTIRLLLYQLGIPFSIIAPPTLKKFTCGKGNVKKDVMIMHAFKRWGESFDDTNTCDAYCLCRYLMEEGHRERES